MSADELLQQIADLDRDIDVLLATKESEETETVGAPHCPNCLCLKKSETLKEKREVHWHRQGMKIFDRTKWLESKISGQHEEFTAEDEAQVKDALLSVCRRMIVDVFNFDPETLRGA